MSPGTLLAFGGRLEGQPEFPEKENPGNRWRRQVAIRTGAGRRPAGQWLINSGVGTSRRLFSLEYRI